MSSITVLGLGAMGSRMAINYARAGHAVTVWNRTESVARELAVTNDLIQADTPGMAVQSADFVVAMVTDDEAATAVWLDPEHGALARLPGDAIAIESSTLTPVAIRHLATAFDERGATFIEAPVVGSRPQAEAGALFYLLGGTPAAIDMARPIIDINAGNSKHAGPVGAAAIMKLAINGLFATQVAAYAEMVGFIERSGLDTDAAISTLSALPITSAGMERILGLIQSGTYEPNFPIHLVAKDLGYLTATADELGAPVPLSGTAREIYGRGAEGDQRDLDIAGIAATYRTTGP